MAVQLAPNSSSASRSFFITNASAHRRHLRLVAAAPSKGEPTLSVAESMACGAIARGTQIFSAFPIDTVKTRLQSSRVVMSASSSPALAQTAGSGSIFANVSKAVSQGKLYSGVGVTLTGQVPYGMLTFGIYESIRSHLQVHFPTLPSWLNIAIAASLGDAFGSLWLTPSEVIKSKQQTGRYSSTVSTIRTIYSSGSGGVFSFYQGYAAALARDIPFRILQMVLFEQCRAAYMRHHGGKEQLSGSENLLIGAFAGSVTALVTNPFDVIRTRIMSQPCGQNMLYKNAMDCIIKTLSKEGPAALFKGAIPRTLMAGPATAIFFLTYEGLKGFFRSRARTNKSMLVGSTAHQHAYRCARRPRVHPHHRLA